MERINEKIDRGKLLLDQLHTISQDMDHFGTPVLDDMNMLPKLMVMLREKLTEKSDARNLRYYFVLVAVMLYCPRCFLGQIMGKGLRMAMAEAMGVSSGATVSQTLSTAMSWMRLDREFRENAEQLYEGLCVELGLKINNIDCEMVGELQE